MSKIKVVFEDPEHGSIWIHLHTETQSVTISATYIFNAFHPLVNALYLIREQPWQTFGSEPHETVIWMCEPWEAEMQFRRKGNIVSLDLIWFPDHRRSIRHHPDPELSISGSYEEICLPFWRALRRLQGRFTAAEFKERWHAPFPTHELAQLTAALGKQA